MINNNINSNKSEEKKLLAKPETIYKLAKISSDQQNYDLARIQFKETAKLFPLSYNQLLARNIY